MIFKTQSGSTYEVDQDNSRIRRVSGYTQETERFQPHGEWKPYKNFDGPEIGSCAIIIWGENVPPIVPGSNPIAKTTITTPVVEIEG